MGRLATFIVVCLFLISYIPINNGFTVGRSRRDADGTVEGLASKWLTKRVRRHEGHLDPFETQTLEEYFKQHLSWLTDDQKQELRDVNSKAHERKEVMDKIIAYYEATTGETKTKATEQLKGRCKSIYESLLTKEQNEEVKKLHESGISKQDLVKKIKKFIDNSGDQKAKLTDNEYGPACAKLFGVEERKKRDTHEGHAAHHGSHKLEDYFKNHLSWLSDTQKEELKTLKSEGKTRKELQDKVFEYYEATSGETKEKATELLRGGCKELLTQVIGEEKTAELKKLKDANTPKEEIDKKVKEFLGEVTDPHKKQIAEEYEAPCKKLYGVSSRKKRSAIEADKLDEALKTHLSWLTDDQKAELKKYKDEGKSFEDAQKKVFEWYDALSGEAKEKATQLLQEGCRTLIKELVGEEKANELKKLRESGASKAEMKEKIVKFMDELTDPAKKEKAVKFAGGCQRVFEIESSRVKRTAIEGEKFEEALKTHLSWLTDDQKEQLRTLKNEGKSFEDVQKKVFEFYEALSGDAKEKATQLLQEGCRSVIKELVGEEKANELKKLRESGASKAELKEKIVKLMDELTDPAKKEKALKFAGGCQKVFEIESRKRRDAPQSKLDEYLKSHLSWLTDDQKETLKTLKAEGKAFKELQDKVFEFYNALPDDAKKAAKEQLQNGCRSLIKEIAGEDKANELKTLRESGASNADIEKKIAEIMDQLTDEDKKQMAVKYAPACKKIFDLSSPARVKRDYQVEADKLQEALNTHLSWLSDEQKSTLKTLQSEGKSFKEVNDKVFEWYGQLSGEAQQKAKELMQGGCRALIKELAGDEKAEELKKLRESGAPKEEIKKKVVEFLDALTDEDKKQKALKYAPACQKIFDLDA